METSRSRATPQDVEYCYRLLLGRSAEPDGLRGHLTLVDNGISLDQLVAVFVNSLEFRRRLAHVFGWDSQVPLRGEVEGCTFYAHDQPGVGATLLAGHTYEPAVTSALTRRLRPGDTFVDIGASIGYFSVVLGNHVGSRGKVLAFEPGPQNVPLLLLNLWANGISWCDVHGIALGRSSALLAYSRDGANGAVGGFDGTIESLATQDLVQARALDEVLAEGQRVDAMKIDVEGREGDVLHGAEGVLRRQRPFLVFEFSPPGLAAHSEMSGRDLLELLADLGYRYDVVALPAQDLTARTADEVLDSFEAHGTDHVDVAAWHAG